MKKKLNELLDYIDDLLLEAEAREDTNNKTYWYLIKRRKALIKCIRTFEKYPFGEDGND